MTTLLSVGDKAPLEITVKNQHNEDVSLQQLLNGCAQLVLYFYPKTIRRDAPQKPVKFVMIGNNSKL